MTVAVVQQIIMTNTTRFVYLHISSISNDSHVYACKRQFFSKFEHDKKNIQHRRSKNHIFFNLGRMFGTFETANRQQCLNTHHSWNKCRLYTTIGNSPGMLVSRLDSPRICSINTITNLLILLQYFHIYLKMHSRSENDGRIVAIMVQYE